MDACGLAIFHCFAIYFRFSWGMFGKVPRPFSILWWEIGKNTMFGCARGQWNSRLAACNFCKIFPCARCSLTLPIVPLEILWIYLFLNEDFFFFKICIWTCFIFSEFLFNLNLAYDSMIYIAQPSFWLNYLSAFLFYCLVLLSYLLLSLSVYEIIWCIPFLFVIFFSSSQ